MDKESKVFNDAGKFKQPTKLSASSSAFNFMVLMIGTAMVATADQFRLTTPWLGLVIEAILGFWAWVSATTIFDVACKEGSTSFIDLGRKVFSFSPFQMIYTFFFVSVPIFIVLIGALAAYITIAADAVQSYIPINPIITQIVFAVFIAALGSINSFENTKFISYVTFVMFMVVVVVVVVCSTILMFETPFEPQESINVNLFVQAFPILVLGLNAHMALPGMAGEMTPEVQRKFPKWLFFSQFTVATINASVGFFPSVLFGRCTESNSASQLSCYFRFINDSDNMPVIIAQICLGLAVVIQAPLLVIPLKEIILDHGGKAVRDRSIFTNVLTSCILAAIAGVLGIFLGNITDTLNTVSTVGGLMIMGTSAATINMMSRKSTKSTWATARNWILIVFGIIFLVINVYTIVVTFMPDTTPVEEDAFTCFAPECH